MRKQNIGRCTSCNPPSPFPHLQRDRVIVEAAEHYLALAQRLQREELPVGTAWRDVEAYREKLVANKEYTWINFREQKV